MAMDVDTLLADESGAARRPVREERGRADPRWRGQGHGDHRPRHGVQPAIAQVINLFAWQGKTFDAAHGVLRNRITALGLNAIVAEVYKGPSWYDRSSASSSTIRRRRPSPVDSRRDPAARAGTYLGKVYGDKKPLIHFALQFD